MVTFQRGPVGIIPPLPAELLSNSSTPISNPQSLIVNAPQRPPRPHVGLAPVLDAVPLPSRVPMVRCAVSNPARHFLGDLLEINILFKTAVHKTHPSSLFSRSCLVGHEIGIGSGVVFHPICWTFVVFFSKTFAHARLCCECHIHF